MKIINPDDAREAAASSFQKFSDEPGTPAPVVSCPRLLTMLHDADDAPPSHLPASRTSERQQFDHICCSDRSSASTLPRLYPASCNASTSTSHDMTLGKVAECVLPFKVK